MVIRFVAVLVHETSSQLSLPLFTFSQLAFYLLRGGFLVLGKSSGNFNFAILRCAATALVPMPNSAVSFSVGGATLQPSSWKYCDILATTEAHQQSQASPIQGKKMFVAKKRKEKKK